MKIITVIFICGLISYILATETIPNVVIGEELQRFSSSAPEARRKNFGNSVLVDDSKQWMIASSDSTRDATDTYSEGIVNIYYRNTTTHSWMFHSEMYPPAWTYEGPTASAYVKFGVSMAIHNDEYLAVAASYSLDGKGTIFMYKRSGTGFESTWDDLQNWNATISLNLGTTIPTFVENNAGDLYFATTYGSKIITTKLLGSGLFNATLTTIETAYVTSQSSIPTSIARSCQDLLLVSSPRNDAPHYGVVYVYNTSDTTWMDDAYTPELIPNPDSSGTTAARFPYAMDVQPLSGGGARLVASAPYMTVVDPPGFDSPVTKTNWGHVYVFEMDASTKAWTHVQTLSKPKEEGQSDSRDSSAKMGKHSVSLSEDADYFSVSTYNGPESLSVFKHNGTHFNRWSIFPMVTPEQNGLFAYYQQLYRIPGDEQHLRLIVGCLSTDSSDGSVSDVLFHEGRMLATPTNLQTGDQRSCDGPYNVTWQLQDSVDSSFFGDGILSKRFDTSLQARYSNLYYDNATKVFSWLETHVPQYDSYNELTLDGYVIYSNDNLTLLDAYPSYEYTLDETDLEVNWVDQDLGFGLFDMCDEEMSIDAYVTLSNISNSNISTFINNFDYDDSEYIDFYDHNVFIDPGFYNLTIVFDEPTLEGADDMTFPISCCIAEADGEDGDDDYCISGATYDPLLVPMYRGVDFDTWFTLSHITVDTPSRELTVNISDIDDGYLRLRAAAGNVNIYLIATDWEADTHRWHYKGNISCAAIADGEQIDTRYKVGGDTVETVQRFAEEGVNVTASGITFDQTSRNVTITTVGACGSPNLTGRTVPYALSSKTAPYTVVAQGNMTETATAGVYVYTLDSSVPDGDVYDFACFVGGAYFTVDASLVVCASPISYSGAQYCLGDSSTVSVPATSKKDVKFTVTAYIKDYSGNAVTALPVSAVVGSTETPLSLSGTKFTGKVSLSSSKSITIRVAGTDYLVSSKVKIKSWIKTLFVGSSVVVGGTVLSVGAAVVAGKVTLAQVAAKVTGKAASTAVQSVAQEAAKQTVTATNSALQQPRVDVPSTLETGGG